MAVVVLLDPARAAAPEAGDSPLPLTAAVTSDGACPTLDEQRRILSVQGPEWHVACHVAGAGEFELAAFIPPGAARRSPHLVVAAVHRDVRATLELELAGPDAAELQKLTGDDWELQVGPARLRGADWLRIDAVRRGATGAGQGSSQAIVSFLRVASGALEHLWTGLGDGRERRGPACELQTTAQFSVSGDGTLIRKRLIARVNGDGQAGKSSPPSPRARLKSRCAVARPTETDVFEVIDDGVNADIAVPDALRARIKSNRLLFLRAPSSPVAFRRFVSDSIALEEELSRAVTDADDADLPDEKGSRGIYADGAFAYVLRGGGRRGLNWRNLREAVGPAGRGVVDALEALDRYDLGVWVEQRTEYGGCHNPEGAERTLSDVATAWIDAPGYVRDAFKPYLAARLNDMAGDACFCDERADREKIGRALQRNAAILSSIPKIGADAARKLRSLATDPSARFACAGPG